MDPDPRVDESDARVQNPIRRPHPQLTPSTAYTVFRTPSVSVNPGLPQRFTAAARSEKSAVTFVLPRTRACRPPCLRRVRWLILRSTFGRVWV